MELKHITTTACPICGWTEIVRESIKCTHMGQDGERKIQLHTNGAAWENREFLCGKRIEYVPNYGKEMSVGVCFHDPEVMRIREKRNADKEKLLKFCADNDIEYSVVSQLRF